MKRCLILVALLGACGVEADSMDAAPSSDLAVADFQGQSGIITLRANHPFRAGFPELKWDGQKLVSEPTTRKDFDCYFFGDMTLEGQASSAALAIRTCDADGTPNLSGVAFHEDQMFSIRQRADGLEFDPVDATEGACGVTSIPVGEVKESATRQFALSSGKPAFIEVLLGRDEALLSGVANGDYAPDPVMTVHAAAAFYDRTSFGRRILPILVGIVDATDSNPWGSAPFFLGRARAGGYVDNINDWAASRPEGVPEFDQFTVLSGYNFTGSTVGLANVGSACTLGRSASVVKGLNNDASVAQTFGHELGHTIGMYHDSDGNACPSSGFVMTAVYNANGPFATEFSSCSVLYADPFLASSDSACITEDSQPAFPVPYCGDGKVEGDEICDCGPMGCEGRNPCCTDSCELAAGATCSPDDPCCDGSICAPYVPATPECFVPDPEPEPVDMGVEPEVDMGTLGPDASEMGDLGGPADEVDPQNGGGLDSGGTDSGCATTSSSAKLLPLAVLAGLFARRL